MARGGAGEQRSDSVDGLPAAANHTANVALAKLKFENRCSASRNFRQHHVVRKFDQLPNDELEKFSHEGRLTTNAHESTRISAGIKNAGVRQPPSPKQRRLLGTGQTSQGSRRSQSAARTQRLFRLATSGLRRFLSCRFCDGWLRRRRRCFRGRRSYRRFRRSFRGKAGDLFLIFLN